MSMSWRGYASGSVTISVQRLHLATPLQNELQKIIRQFHFVGKCCRLLVAFEVLLRLMQGQCAQIVRKDARSGGAYQ